MLLLANLTVKQLAQLPHRCQMVVHIEFEAVYVDGKRFVHARQVFPSELYKKAVAWRILELGQAGKLGHYDTPTAASDYSHGELELHMVHKLLARLGIVRGCCDLTWVPFWGNRKGTEKAVPLPLCPAGPACLNVKFRWRTTGEGEKKHYLLG
jgi:hypothetical protein